MREMLQPIILMLALVVSGHAQTKGCDAANSKEIWPTPYADGFVTIEPGRDKEGSALQLVLVRQASSCRPQPVDHYSWEGGPPHVDTAFTYAWQGTPYLFVVVRWEINYRGIGTYGQLYQVYAYRKDGRGGLVRDEELTQRSEMTGIDGMSDGAPSYFEATQEAIEERLRALTAKMDYTSQKHLNP